MRLLSYTNGLYCTLLIVALIGWSEGFVGARRGRSTWPLHAATTTRVEKPSTRLKKARLLLEELNKEPLELDRGSNDTASSSVLIPSYSLGRLEGSSSSRWMQGVKVAEPLVKYDPIAAEKLLFRQPRKWLVRNFQIALPIGWWAASVVMDFLGGKSKENRRARAQQLTTTISYVLLAFLCVSCFGR